MNSGAIFPWKSGNRFELLVDGPAFMPAMLADIDAAEPGDHDRLPVRDQRGEDLVAAARPAWQQVDPRRAVEVAPMAPPEITERGGVGGVEERGLERLHV